MLFLHNTSRVDDEPYPRLLQEKGFGGFPSLCFMDADGNVLITQGQRSVAAFEESRVKLQGLMDVRAQIAALGDGKKDEKDEMTESSESDSSSSPAAAD